ncbi:hypothetical protein BC830DRAFT_1164336 [Chytriomyces sp. MP71]|nr:hypothetical protein BC830DRAFT_1164336 [Chytriomyces sp. MP71]
MADLDWCLCGRATFDGELYCSDNCYYVDVGVEELRPVAVIRSQRRPAAPSINKIVIAPKLGEGAADPAGRRAADSSRNLPFFHLTPLIAPAFRLVSPDSPHPPCIHPLSIEALSLGCAGQGSSASFRKLSRPLTQPPLPSRCFCGRPTTDEYLYCSDDCMRSDGYDGPCILGCSSSNPIGALFTPNFPSSSAPQQQHQLQPMHPIPTCSGSNLSASYNNSNAHARVLAAPVPQRRRYNTTPFIFNQHASGNSSPLSPIPAYQPIAFQNSPVNLSNVLSRLEALAAQA